MTKAAPPPGIASGAAPPAISLASFLFLSPSPPSWIRGTGGEDPPSSLVEDTAGENVEFCSKLEQNLWSEALLLNALWSTALWSGALWSTALWSTALLSEALLSGAL